MINNIAENILKNKHNALANEHNEEEEDNAQLNIQRNKKNAIVKHREHKPKAMSDVNTMPVDAIDLEIK